MSVVAVTPEERKVAEEWFDIVVVKGSARSVSALSPDNRKGLIVHRACHLYGRLFRGYGDGQYV